MSKYLLTNFLNTKFKNPVVALSGCYGFGFDFSAFFDKNFLGGITLKGLTLLPREGNGGYRIAETPSGILNSIGLENPGIEYFVEKLWPQINKQITSNVIININGNTIDEYEQIAKILANINAVNFIELNISCPNVKCGGMAFGTDPKIVYEITNKIKTIIGSKKLIVKLSPNVTDIKAIAIAAEQGGADALCLINTILAMDIDLNTKQPLLGNTYGGLSGPAIFPIALRMVHQIYQVVKIPIIGCGGVQSAQDIIKMMMAGATLVGIGTIMLTKPETIQQIVDDLENYCTNNKIDSISSIIGIAHRQKGQ